MPIHDFIMAASSTNQVWSTTNKYGSKFVSFALMWMVSYGITMCNAYAARYLIVLGPDKGSMMFTTIAIGDALIERGQNVTVLVDEIIADRVKEHNAKFDLEIYKSTVTAMEVKQVEQQTTTIALSEPGFKAGWYWSIEMMDGLFYRQCRDLLAQEDVIERIRRSHFDLVLASLGHICPVLVAKLIDVPFIGLMQSFLPQAFAHAYHVPINSAYMPPGFTGWSDRMPFHQRLLAALFSIAQWPSFLNAPFAFQNFVQLKNEFNISADKSIMRMMEDAELWFIMSHVALDYPHPIMPDTIHMGGLTTKPANPLTKNFEDFMQSSGDSGVIVFAMGTTTSGIGEDFTNIFAETFAQLPHKVIWKLGGEPPKDVPDNVMLARWLQQNDLLGHPKTTIMISHCGLNGVYEALYHAVPIVCIPVFGDHYDVAARVVSKHIGIEIEVKALTSEGLVAAVKKIMEDTSYRDTIQHLSAIYRDEPLSPAHRGAYWMEYVVRHGNAKHLRSAAHDLNFVQYHLLDVIAVLFVIMAVAFTVIFWCFRAICRCCCRMVPGQKIKSD